MRFALCDGDRSYTNMVEVTLSNLGHEVVGVTTTGADSVALIESARPDAVIVDLSLSVNSDFDPIATAVEVGAIPIVFSREIGDDLLARYQVRPLVVHKPDLTALEQAVGRLGINSHDQVEATNRRKRQPRVAKGPIPTTISDPQAFFGALQAASAGDALVAVHLAQNERPSEVGSVTAVRVRAVMRTDDRLLMSPMVIRIFLPGADHEGVRSFHDRLVRADALPADASLSSVVIAPDEDPSDAFDRLRAMDPS